MMKKYEKWFSSSLNRDMEYVVYGDSGKPVIVFPTAGGRFFQFEDSGMLEVCMDYVTSGKIQIFAVDGIDWEHFEAYNKSETERAAYYEAYRNYITDELVPNIYRDNKGKEKILTIGASLGGFHALNTMLRRPDIFDSVISMSGIYNTARYFKGFMNQDLYLNSPLLYLENLENQNFIEEYYKSKIIISCGQGRWEEDAHFDFNQMKKIFDTKKIPAFFDLWGFDVSHEFVWWRKQLVYFINKVLF